MPNCVRTGEGVVVRHGPFTFRGPWYNGLEVNAMAVEVVPAQQPAMRPSPGRMTFEEYLDWLDDDTHAEWVNGEVVMHSPVSLGHNDLSGFLLAAIKAFVQEHGGGYVGHEPFQMRIDAIPSSRSPDILFVAAEHLDRLKHSYLDGPADLAIEIISPSSQARDRGDKYFEYERAGIREYWVIDPDRRRAEFHLLGADAAYSPVQQIDGVYRSTVLDGLWLCVDWLWQDPLPSIFGVLQEWNAT
jgi:Uma2 family endonuclease